MSILLQPVNVSWLITNRCNYTCGFCWRVVDRSDLSLERAKEVTLKLALAGTLKISWAGGEPLLWPGIDELIRYTKALGIETMLITNGSLLSSTWPFRLPDYLDWLRLPLEGIGNQVNARCGRRYDHYTIVENILKKCQRLIGPKLKINTVATSLNWKDIIHILDYLDGWKIERWKIFQFYPIRGFAKLNQE
jgi:radical S-adenosyl methionine domain-containing protein 2